MKCIQTLWTKNVGKEDVLSVSAGWRAPEYHWMSWALSCLQLKKMVGEVALITDANGKYVLSTLFQLPYSHIATPLDDEMKTFPTTAWAAAKLYAYKAQTTPFLHFDSDFYLWHKLEEHVLNAQLVAQNLEKDLPFYRAALDAIKKNFISVPGFCQPAYYNNQPVYACNAGIFGGNNLSFIQQYCRYAIDFVEANKDCFGFEKAADVNFVFEQYFLYCLSLQERVPITFLSQTVQENPAYSNYVHFNDVPSVPFIHPVGGYKKNVEICDHVARRLRAEHPEYYYRIIEVLDKEKQLFYTKTFYRGKQLHCNANLFFSDGQHVYKRTIAALHYIQENDDNADKKEIEKWKKSLQQNYGAMDKEKLQRTITNKQHYQLLLQLFTLELKKTALYQKVFVKHQKQEQLYNQEVRLCQLIQQHFADTVDKTERIIVKQHTHLVLISVSRNWLCKIPELTSQMISDKFGEQDGQQTKMALVPNITRRDIEEHYLELIDVIIVRLCKRKRCLSDLIHDMKAYFSAEEIRSNYNSFRYLIVNTVKRLLYLNILSLEEDA